MFFITVGSKAFLILSSVKYYYNYFRVFSKICIIFKDSCVGTYFLVFKRDSYNCPTCYCTSIKGIIEIYFKHYNFIELKSVKTLSSFLGFDLISKISKSLRRRSHKFMSIHKVETDFFTVVTSTTFG